MSDAVIVALVSGMVALVSAIISFVGSQSAAKRSSDLIQYRIDRLEEKVNAHNNLIERMTKVEMNISAAWKKIDDLSEANRHDHAE